MAETVDLTAALERKIRETIETLEASFVQKRDGIAYWLTHVNPDALDSPGPLRIYGIDTAELDSITIQIGTLRLVLRQILELRQRQEDPVVSMTPDTTSSSRRRLMITWSCACGHSVQVPHGDDPPQHECTLGGVYG